MILSTKNNLLIITSALYAESNDKICDIKSFLRRRNRLVNTINFYFNYFNNILIWDQTIPDNISFDILPGSKYFKRLPCNNIFLNINNSSNATSILEAALLYNGLLICENEIKQYDRIIKVSAGYLINNVTKILTNSNAGVVFKFGNPFRLKERFCFTAFYILFPNDFIQFAKYAYKEKILNSCNKPIEYNLWKFIKNKRKRQISLPYPDINAYFWTVGQSSKSFIFQFKLLIYKMLSYLGIFAYSID